MKKSRKFFAFLLSVVMILAAFPAYAEESADPEAMETAEVEGAVEEAETDNIAVEAEELSGPLETISVTTSSQAYGVYLHTPQVVEISSDIAESYGYTDSNNTGVSMLDALVVEHEILFGSDFTEETKAAYLDVSDSGWITTIFGEETNGCGYFLNDESVWSLDRAVTEGDVCTFFLYSDLTAWSDYYTFLTTENETVYAGDTVEVALTGFMAAYGGDANVLEDVQLGMLDMTTGEVEPLDIYTDEDGVVAMTFDEVGEYYLVPISDEEYELYYIMNPLYIQVTENPLEALEAHVIASSQSMGTYMSVPQELTVNAWTAEGYGYSDMNTETVSMLDVLVAEHALIFGEDFNITSAADYLGIDESGWITTIFGEETSGCGYFLNDESVWSLGQAVADEDVCTFFLYGDGTAWSDIYTFLTVPEEAAIVGKDVEITVTGFTASWNQGTFPVEGVQIGMLDMETGEVTVAEGATTDADGKIMICFEEAGSYYLVATADFEEKFVLMNPVEITVEEAPFVLDPVTDLKAAATSRTSVKLTWSAVEGADGYLIYGRHGAKGAYTKLGLVAGTNFVDKAALSSEYNFYWVYPYAKAEDGTIITNTNTKYTYAIGRCAPVTNLKAAGVTGGVKLTWDKTAGAEGYLVYGIRADKAYGYVGMTTKGTTLIDKEASKTDYNFYWVFPYHKDATGKMITGSCTKYTYGKAK